MSKESSSALLESEMGIWEVMQYITTPKAMRKILIDGLSKHPLTQEIRMTLWDDKESKSEYKERKSFGTEVNFLVTLQDGRVVSTDIGPIHRIRVWNLMKGTYLPIILGKKHSFIRSLTALPNGKMAILIETQSDNKLKGKTIAIIEPEKGIIAEYADLDIERLIALSGDYLVGSGYNFFDTKASIKCYKISENSLSFVPPVGELKEHKNHFHHYSLAALPDGKFISGEGLSIKIRDLATGACVTTIDTDNRKYLAVFPDGRIASASDSQIQIWDPIKGTCLVKFLSDVRVLAVLPNNHLVSGGYDGSIRIYDISKGNCIATLTGHAKSITALTVLPNGQLVSGSTDNTIRLWQAGGCPLTLDLHFQSGLLEANPSFSITENQLNIITSLSCEGELKALGAVLQTVCPDHKLTIITTATSLTINGLSNSELCADLEGLCQAFSITKALAPAPRSVLSSLIGRPGGLYARPRSESDDKNSSTASASSASSSSSLSSS